MSELSVRQLLGIVLLGLSAFTLSARAHADPPSRVARLAYVSGTVSFSPGGESDWVHASINRPLITGDRLWADAGARSELQLGAAAIRMGSRTSMTLLNLDDRIAQVQLTQGILNIRIWRMDRDQELEIDTPNLAYLIRKPGSYRVEVNASDDATAVQVRSGHAEVFGEGRAFVIEPGQGFEFFGAGLRDYDSFAPSSTDDFDRWSFGRDRRWENSVSARYVSRDLIGYEDLDEYGTWREVYGYGHVWTPTRVAADWAPYRDGHWAWVEPWGWTWVDDSSWGFAPSHYGRWVYIDAAWAWVPGPVEARPVYAPALVAFVGGSNFNLSLTLGGGGAVAWFPLAPREVYRPSYAVSRQYFTSVNSSNTIVNAVNIVNVYNKTNITKVVYANQHVPGAVVAVPTTTFVQSRSVAREAIRVNREVASTSPAVAVVPLAPARTSVLGAAALSIQPPQTLALRPVVARTAPPPPPASFAQRERALAVNLGRPLDAAAVKSLTPATPPPATSVTLVTPQSASSPPPPRALGVVAPERTRPAAAQASVPVQGGEMRGRRLIDAGMAATSEAGTASRPPANLASPHRADDTRSAGPAPRPRNAPFSPAPEADRALRAPPEIARPPETSMPRRALVRNANGNTERLAEPPRGPARVAPPQAVEETRRSVPALAPRNTPVGSAPEGDRTGRAPSDAPRPPEPPMSQRVSVPYASPNVERAAEPGSAVRQPAPTPPVHSIPATPGRVQIPGNRPPADVPPVLSPGGLVAAPARPAPMSDPAHWQQRPELNRPVGRHEAASDAKRIEEQRR